MRKNEEATRTRQQGNKDLGTKTKQSKFVLVVFLLGFVIFAQFVNNFRQQMRLNMQLVA
jgi:hypothetical protein